MTSKVQDKSSRKRRKPRTTDMSSPSASEGDSSSKEESNVKKPKSKKRKTKTPDADSNSVALTAVPEVAQPAQKEADSTAQLATVSQVGDVEAEEAFTSFYLRQITSDFAEDLDKVRSANDFKDSSLVMLIDALKQGRSCFAKEERLSIGRLIASQQE